jgi:hypothetical protein
MLFSLMLAFCQYHTGMDILWSITKTNRASKKEKVIDEFPTRDIIRTIPVVIGGISGSLVVIIIYLHKK